MFTIYAGTKRITQETITDKAAKVRQLLQDADAVIIGAGAGLSTAAGIEYAAVAVTAALGVTAMLRYALGDMVLADHPETGPVKAAEESKRLTKGRKGLLFSLYLSFIFWYLAETAYALDVDLETVLSRNVEKLRRRYPGGFEAEKSLDRTE